MFITISTITPTGTCKSFDLDNDYDADKIQSDIDDYMEGFSLNPDVQEWHVVDYDRDLIPSEIAQETDPELWVQWAEAYEEHGDALLAYINNVGLANILSGAIYAFEDVYFGSFRDEEEAARELLDQTGELREIPEHLRDYFDFESYAHDLFTSDMHSCEESGGRIYAFFNR